MIREITINLSNLLLSLSDAVDLASPSIGMHQMRTAFASWQIAQEGGCSQEGIEKIYAGALLHDIGALTPEDKVRLHDFEELDLLPHCLRGEWLYELTPLLRPSSGIVRFHHRPWKEWAGREDHPDAMPSQVVYLADLLERIVDRKTFILHQVKKITQRIRSLAGTEIHPRIVDAFLNVAKREDFWLDLASPRLYSSLLGTGPFHYREIGLEELSSVADLFRTLIDFRSRFTATHSSGVAECSAALAELFGLTDTEILLVRIAGDFHDLGKLAVPNSILDKQGPLTPEEFALAKQHAYFTYSVLNTIEGMEQIAEWAAFHHERLDGTGYPFHIKAQKLSTGARIVATADVFTALVEDRPYRDSMSRNKVTGILAGMAKNKHLDERIVQLLLDNYDLVLERVKARQAEAKERFENQFLEVQAPV